MYARMCSYNYAILYKLCSSMPLPFYFKFGKNTSITMQQTCKWQKKPIPYN